MEANNEDYKVLKSIFKDDSDIPHELLIGETIYNKLKESRGIKGKDIAAINANTGVGLTFEEYYTKSVKLAVALKNLGLKKGDVVAIVSENVVNYWIPILASFYLGAVVNPLNPLYTKGEMKRSFNQSRPKFIFCSENFKNVISELYNELSYIEKVIFFGETTPFTDLKSSKECINGLDVDVDNFQPVKASMDDVILILCSSGTTGFPKGVMLTHNSPRHYIVSMSDPRFGKVDNNAACFIVPPYFHLIGCMQQLLAFYIQCLSVILSKFKPDVFLKSIQDYKLKRMLVVPPLLVFLSNSPLVDNYDLSSVEEISWGGSAMSPSVEEAVSKRLNLTAIRQAYGATETGSVTTFQVDLNKRGSAGCLSHEMMGKVCNPETNEKLGPREIGEIRLKGYSVMKGYVNNPEATLEAFDDEGFLKTGDAGYYDEDGYFYIVDRFKELIKYKAFQVPPAEIEAILLTHSAVKEVTVIPKPDERAGEVPIAFIVKQDDKDVTEQELVDLVAENLSIQKRLYGGVRFVNEIPKTSTGKVNRKQLKDIARTLNDDS